MPDTTLSSGTFVESRDLAWVPMAAGLRRQVLAYGPDLMMVRLEFEPGAAAPVHQHPHRQATYVAAGAFEVTVNGETRRLAAGDSFFVTGDVPHGVVALAAGTLIDVFTPAREDLLR